MRAVPYTACRIKAAVESKSVKEWIQMYIIIVTHTIKASGDTHIPERPEYHDEMPSVFAIRANITGKDGFSDVPLFID